MLLVHLSDWERIRDRFDDQERADLYFAVSRECACRGALLLDPMRIQPPLFEKLAAQLGGEALTP